MPHAPEDPKVGRKEFCSFLFVLTLSLLSALMESGDSVLSM